MATTKLVAPIAATDAASLKTAREQDARLMLEGARLSEQVGRYRGLLDRGVVHTTPPSLRQMLQAEEALPGAAAALARVRLEQLELKPRLQELEAAERDRLTDQFHERRRALAVRFSSSLRAAARDAVLFQALISEEYEALGTAPFDLGWPELLPSTALQSTHVDEWHAAVQRAGLLDTKSL